MKMTVSYVIDGDTFVGIDLFGIARRIRLRNINAPEIWQPGGAEAKNHLEWWLPPGREVDVEIYAQDIYDRTIATASVDGFAVSYCDMECECWIRLMEQWSAGNDAR